MALHFEKKVGHPPFAIVVQSSDCRQCLHPIITLLLILSLSSDADDPSKEG